MQKNPHCPAYTYGVNEQSIYVIYGIYNIGELKK